MQQAQIQTGKKVALRVGQDDASKLRENTQDFFNALRGKTVKPDDQVLFGDVLLWVEATKPKGVVAIGRDTKVKVAISKKELRQSCPSCGQAQDEHRRECAGCGADLQVVSL
ncbi:hypothetical protein [Desulfoferula mesophila]|uniref:Zinc ribbon domain-containing protein n=1 Tax=Desulfoferula mesophila TaxID=3058419 RepID=A0AAU9E7U2_9BACT|nr:hypothetical protein FAK_00710 [Desulfoferula mesophilus]